MGTQTSNHEPMVALRVCRGICTCYVFVCCFGVWWWRGKWRQDSFLNYSIRLVCYIYTIIPWSVWWSPQVQTLLGEHIIQCIYMYVNKCVHVTGNKSSPDSICEVQIVLTLSECHHQTHPLQLHPYHLVPPTDYWLLCYWEGGTLMCSIYDDPLV